MPQLVPEVGTAAQIGNRHIRKLVCAVNAFKRFSEHNGMMRTPVLIIQSIIAARNVGAAVLCSVVQVFQKARVYVIVAVHKSYVFAPGFCYARVARAGNALDLVFYKMEVIKRSGEILRDQKAAVC